MSIADILDITDAIGSLFCCVMLLCVLRDYRRGYLPWPRVRRHREPFPFCS